MLFSNLIYYLNIFIYIYFLYVRIVFKFLNRKKARYMNRPPDANTASCPKLSSLSVSGDEFNMKRKPQGKNCITTKVFRRRRAVIRVSPESGPKTRLDYPDKRYSMRFSAKLHPSQGILCCRARQK